jgi:hypothetical protein
MTTAGEDYSAFVEAQLAEERATKTSLEGRGITVITTSGGLVTLLFGLVALATKGAQTYTLPDAATKLLIAAAALLTVAGVFGLLTNWGLSYREASVEGLRDLLDRDWTAAEPAGQRDVAATTIDILQASRDNNAAKARMLRVAMGMEIAGVLAVALAAVNVLTG